MSTDFGVRYYDKYGMPISMERFSQLLSNHAEKHVAKTQMRVHGHEYYLSTVWLGLDHNWISGGPPIIFETMAFADDDWSGVDGVFERYSTLAQAKAGHKKWLAVLKHIAHETPKPKQLIHSGGKP